MFRRNFSRLALASALLVATGLSVPAAPQDIPGKIIVIPDLSGKGGIGLIPIALPIITLPCCRCVDGSVSPVDIGTGTVAWRVTAPNGTDTQAVVVPNRPASWTNALAPAQWVAHPAGSAVGNHVFVLRFHVPRCLIPMRVTLAGRSAADNRQTVFLDNVPLASFQNASGVGFTTANIQSFTAPPPPIGPGTHTLRVVVTNISGPSGLALRAALTVTCPDNPQLSRTRHLDGIPQDGVEARPAA